MSSSNFQPNLCINDEHGRKFWRMSIKWHNVCHAYQSSNGYELELNKQRACDKRSLHTHTHSCSIWLSIHTHTQPSWSLRGYMKAKIPNLHLTSPLSSSKACWNENFDTTQVKATTLLAISNKAMLYLLPEFRTFDIWALKCEHYIRFSRREKKSIRSFGRRGAKMKKTHNISLSRLLTKLND